MRDCCLAMVLSRDASPRQRSFIRFLRAASGSESCLVSWAMSNRVNEFTGHKQLLLDPADLGCRPALKSTNEGP